MVKLVYSFVCEACSRGWTTEDLYADRCDVCGQRGKGRGAYFQVPLR